MTMGRQPGPYRGQPPIPNRPPVPGRRPMPGGPSSPGSRPLPGGSFTDRVMSRVAAEPTPSPARVLLRSLRHLALRDALAALLAAWRLTFEPAGSVSPATRASAAGVFLSVILFVGVGSAMVSAGALALLGSDGQPQPMVPAASPSAVPVVTLAPSPSPSATPTPSPTTKPSTKAKPERATPKPTRTPKASPDDDKGDEREDRKERQEDEREKKAEHDD